MDVIDKIRKLLALSTSSNPHEAANAAARAQELMFAHKIESADLEIAGSKQEAEPVGDHTILSARWREPWKGSLANAIAHSIGCRMYWHGPNIQIVGRRSEVETGRYLFGYLVLEIERLATVGWSLRRGTTSENATVWKNNFRLGAVVTIRERFDAQKRDQEAKARVTSCTALAIVQRDEAAVVAFYKRLDLRGKVRTSSKTSRDGYAAGQVAGGSIEWGGARAAIGGSKQRLK